MDRRHFLSGAAGTVLGAAIGPSPEDADWPRSPVHEALLAEAQRSVDRAAAAVALDRFRPAFHFTPPARFMNDPNGCVRFGGAYHVFYQHLPFFGEASAPMVPGWGHARSRDLVHWEHLPIALMPVPGTYDAAGVASGACVVAGGKPTIVYTSVPPQAQSLARSFDGGRTWRRYARNPVLRERPPIPGLGDGFRDPCVWRESGRWKMLVGSGIADVGGTVLLYESSDLRAWSFLGSLCSGMGPDCFQWECPSFFRLGDRWVLIVSPLLHSEPALRGPVQYAVGHYDGRRFEHGGWHPLDLGGPGVFYAPNTLADARGRRILFGWLMGGGDAAQPWNGLLTLPRELSAGPDGHLRVWPAREVDSLRVDTLADLGRCVLRAGESTEVARGTQVDVLVEVERGSRGRLDMHVLAPAAGADGTVVRYDLATGELRHGDRVGLAPDRGARVRTLRILVDRSVVEVYAGGATMSIRAYPPPADDALRLAARGGDVAVRRVRAYRMASIWS